MSQRKLFVLGTASLVPTARRNHNGYFLRWDDEGFLFDPGEGTQRQLIFAGVSASQITKIFISHFHGDHCLGLPGIIQRLSLDQVSHPINIYYPASGEKYYKNLRDASIYYAQVNLVEHAIEQPGVVFEHEKYFIEAKRLEHTAETFGYRIQERDDHTMIPEKLKAAGVEGSAIRELKEKGKIKVNGNTITLQEMSHPRPGQGFAYILDTRVCDAAVELANNADMMVCDSTYLSDREQTAEEFGHMTAKQAAQLAKTAKARKLVLTHFSQIYPDEEEFAAEARAIFRNVVAAKDGKHIVMPKRRRLLS